MTLAYACELLVDIDDLRCDCQLPADEDQIELVLEGTSDFLSFLAAMPLGRCSAKYRPVRQCWDTCSPCSCCGLRGIHLPGLEPAVTEVKINGAVVDPDEYAVLVSPLAGQYVLERLDANGDSIWWPRNQHVTRPSTAQNTFEITVASGFAKNLAMTMAAAEVACDVFTYLATDEANLLPRGVAAVVAGGISLNYLRFGDPTDQSTMNLAGLTMVQRFLQTLPEKPTGTQILAPELDDGWELWGRAA